MTVLAVSLVPFIGTTMLGLGGAAWAWRAHGRHADWAGSLACSTTATGAGALLIAEVGIRLLLGSLIATEVPLRLFPITAWIYVLWSFLLGPALLYVAFSRRARRTPPRIYALQLVQLAAWLLSCLFILCFGMAS
jgi:hypothetical protein